MKHMKYLILSLLISLNSFGQSGKQFWFKEVNWKITLPSNFTLVDSIIDAQNSMTKISASKGQTTNFMLIISQTTVPNMQYWDSINNNEIKYLFKAMFDQSPSSKFDTLRTKRIIDGVDFNEFQINVKLSNGITFHNIYLARLYERRNTISINYYYFDEIDRQAIEKSLSESKFLPTKIGVIN